MKNRNLVPINIYREPNKAKLFRDTCKELGLSMSAIGNLLIDTWMVDKEVYKEAKMNLIKAKSLGRNLVLDSNGTGV